MEGIILKCPKGYIKKIGDYHTVVSSKEDATLYFSEEYVDCFLLGLASYLDVKVSSIEKLKVKRTTTIIN